MLRLAVVVAVLVVYSFFSKKFERRLSGPIVFMTVGILISEPFLGWFVFDLNSGLVQILFKGALALVLFNEASVLGMRRVSETGLPARLLLGAMPLVMIGGVVVAAMLFGVLGFWEAAVVAALLAPTDAALGLPVVSNTRVPQRVRDALVIEGGLNDGLAVPFAVFAAAFAEASSSEAAEARLVELLITQIGIAVVVGIIVGWLLGKFAAVARSRDWAKDQWIRASLIGVVVITFAIAEGYHGSGFIAAWVGGLVFGLVSGREMESYQAFSEDESTLLVMLSFLAFGAIAVGPAIDRLDWAAVVYAVLSLAAIRPIAVALSMIGSNEKPPTVLFMGWFGPRGLPSLVLALILISEGFVLAEGPLVIEIVVVTVAVSVYLHGLTAGPLSDVYARWSENREAMV